MGSDGLLPIIEQIPHSRHATPRRPGSPASSKVFG
jgi:hypothetical protein